MSIKHHLTLHKNLYGLFFGLAILWVLLSIFLFNKTDIQPTPDFFRKTIAPTAKTIEFFIMLVSFIVSYLNIRLYRFFEKKDKENFKWLTLSCILFSINLFLSNCDFFMPDPSPILDINSVICYFFYLGWLLFSLFFFYLLLKNYIWDKKSSLTMTFILIIFSLSIVVLIGLSIKWGRPFSQYPGFGHAVLAILITILYDLTIICLINSKNTGIRIILIGKLILIAASLWVMDAFIEDSGINPLYFYFHHKKNLIDLWIFGDLYGLLGFIVILIGYFILLNNKSYSIEQWFRKSNSIISRLVSLVFGISMISFIFFFILAYALSMVEKSMFFASPFFLIIYSILVIMLSVFIGQYFEHPFKKIMLNMNTFLNDKNEKTMDDSFSIMEFIFLQKFIANAFKENKEKNRIKQQLIELASQVSHDIRSPLTVLDMILMDLSEVEEEKRLIVRNAVSRIRDISNNLLTQNKILMKAENIIKNCLLSDIIESAISEKRLQLFNQPTISLEFNYAPTSYGIFSNINPVDFKIILSNLMNNAIEACMQSGKIKISLFVENKNISILIQDDGKGIPPQILKELGNRGITYGKEHGFGLGVSHAMKIIDTWKGNIYFTSVLGEGTTVHIQLPLSPPPSWFLEKIEIPLQSKILILDDDSSIHQVWNTRFKQLNLKNHRVTWHHFYDDKELENWIIQHHTENRLLILCDYELLSTKNNGIDILQALGLTHHAILVTSRYEDKIVYERCEKLQIKILPKSLAPLIPIFIKKR